MSLADEDVRELEGADDAAAAGPRTRRRRRWLVLVTLVVLGLVFAWALLSAGTVLRAQESLEAGRDAALRAISSGRDADVEGAAEALAEARANFLEGQLALDSALLVPLRAVPVAGANLRAARDVAEAGKLTATGGLRIARSVVELPRGLASLAPRDGRLPVSVYASLGAPMADARLDLDAALALLDQTPVEGVVEQVTDAQTALRDELEPVADTLGRVGPLVQTLPRLLGVAQPRRYFVGASTPAEARGATGFMGAWAILEIDDGAFSFTPFSSIHDLPPLPEAGIPAPNPQFEERYARFSALTEWPFLNVSPDFPSTGRAVTSAWETTFGEQLDGVISVDPFALEALLEVAGSQPAPTGGRLTPDNVVRYVSNEAYGLLGSQAERQRVLGDVAQAALQGFFERGLETETPEAAVETIGALGRASADGHLNVYAENGEVQSALELAGLAGRLVNPDGDFFAAFVNGTTSSKVDYYLQKSIRYDVELLPDGSAEVDARVMLRNTAPREGQPKYVIGPNVSRAEAGEAQVYIATYLAEDAQLRGVFVPGRDVVRGRRGTELGHPIVETFERLPSGSEQVVRYRTGVPDAWFLSDGLGRYRLTLQEQALIQPAIVDVRVRLPEGASPAATGLGWSREGDLFRWTGELRGLEELRLPFRP